MNSIKAIILPVLLFSSSVLFVQKPFCDGVYTFKVEYNEWSGKSMGATCIVKIKNDSIWVIHNGSKGIAGKKGEIIDKGILIKHKSGKWIIAENKDDSNIPEVGGCSDGPRIIDFKRRRISFC